MVKHVLSFLFLTFYFSCNFLAQEKSIRIIEAELMGGKIVPNYSVNFPKSTIQSGFALTIGSIKTDSSSWAKHYNFPETGVSFFASNLGNNKIYGNQFSLSPYIQFKLKQCTNPFYIKLILGASYFTSHYDSSNIRNVAIGSDFTWGFQAFLYKNIYHNKGTVLRLGGGYSHASNGHTQLPNFGLNSALLSLSAQFYNPTNEIKDIKTRTLKEKSKTLFFNLRGGLGFHELGGTAEPIGGEKREIYTSALSLGLIFNKYLKIRTGFAYRYYEQYNNYIKTTKHPDFISTPTLSSSNIYFFLGSEFLMGHIGLDVSGGLNLYKPFYKEFNTVYEKNEGLRYYLKKLFTTRMGLNVYLLNTNKVPTHNIFIGAHINANFGQADFTEFNFGYQFSIN